MKKLPELTKEDIKGPDKFISLTDQIIKRLEGHAKTILTLMGLLLVGGIAKVSYDAYVNSKEEKAQVAFADVEIQTAKAPATDESEKKWLEFVNKYSGTRAGAQGAISLAASYTQKGQSDKAEGIIRQALRNFNVDDFFYGLLKGQLAVVLTNLKRYDEALGIYNELIGSTYQTHIHPDLMLKMALIYEVLGDIERARGTLQKVNQQYPNTEAAMTARGYLRSLAATKKAS